jgi:hypothetical protein
MRDGASPKKSSPNGVCSFVVHTVILRFILIWRNGLEWLLFLLPKIFLIVLLVICTAFITLDVHNQDGRLECMEEAKESQIVARLARGVEMTRQKRPNLVGSDATSCKRDMYGGVVGRAAGSGRLGFGWEGEAAHHIGERCRHS